MPSGSNVDLGNHLLTPNLSAGALNAYLVPPTDVTNYKWISLFVGSSVYSGILTFQYSFDLTNWFPVSLFAMDDLDGTLSSTQLNGTQNILVGGPVRFPYFAVQMTSYSSGGAIGILDLRTDGPAGFQLLTTNTVLARGNTIIGETMNDGTLNAEIAAGTTSDTVINANAGFLARCLVTATGTNAMYFYDNVSAGSGTPVGIIPASATVGTLVPMHAPCVNGITAKGNALNPGVTVFYANL